MFKRTNGEKDGDYQGDLEGFEHYTNAEAAKGFAAFLTGMAIYQGYRFVKTQKWAPDWIGSDALQLNFQPNGRDGAALMIQLAF